MEIVYIHGQTIHRMAVVHESRSCVSIRAVDLDPTEPADVLARHVFDEIFVADGPVDVEIVDYH